MTLRIACIHQGYELYGSDRSFAESVAALRQAMDATDLPILFRPTLPWFTSLEGHPGYDALVRERAGRIATIKAEMLAIEAGQARADGPQAAGLVEH